MKYTRNKVLVHEIEKKQSFGPWNRKETKFWSSKKKRDNVMVHEVVNIHVMVLDRKEQSCGPGNKNETNGPRNWKEAKLQCIK